MDLACAYGIDAVNPGQGVKQVEYVLGKMLGVTVIITHQPVQRNHQPKCPDVPEARRIVLVGVIGLDIKRSDFYEKELSFQRLALTAPR